MTVTQTPETAVPEDAYTRPCASWCEIDDHDDADDGEMRHMSWTAVPLSHYAYEVDQFLTGNPVRHLDWMNISREQLLDREQVIVIEAPAQAGCEDPDEHLQVAAAPGGEVMLTFAEAEQLAISLLAMTRRTEGSLHVACEPGDPSPCCPDSSLRTAVYPTAVFCSGCGSLYWQAEVPADEPAIALLASAAGDVPLTA